MSHRPLLVCIAVACGMSLAPQAAAQVRPPASVEASVGFRAGHGGTYVNRGGAAFDMVLAQEVRRTAAGALVGAFALGAQTPIVLLDVCLLLPDGGCAPDFPVLYSVGALLGAQWGTARTVSARVAGGPVGFLADQGGWAMGLQSRLDVASPAWQRTAVVASLRHSALPSFRGEAVGVSSFGLGLRIQ